VSPYHAEKEWAGGAHDSNIWEEPGAVVAWKGVDDFEEERVVWDAAHDIVGNTGGYGAANPGAVCEKRVETALAALGLRLALLCREWCGETNVIKINVDTAKVGEDKVSYSVCSLDWELVVVESL
jgi:hypothetical protein